MSNFGIHAGRLARAVVFSVIALSGGLAWAQPSTTSGGSDGPDALVRRTSDGIPHIRATTWRSLGEGYGRAQAEDALCTLADAFVTYRGQRAWYFGASATPPTRSTFGNPPNLDLDFFFKAFASPAAVQALQREQPAELKELIAGYAQGYNRHLQGLRQRKRGAVGTPACLDEPWVQSIGPDDIYRRMIAAGLAGGYAHFVSEIVNAKPSSTTPPESADQRSLAARLATPVGDARGIGSNVMAFGQAATGERGGVLFGNPHWYWGGPDRFYQAHLTLPGVMNVAGVSFLGVPVIMIGFNNDVAWSHTVSTARRFGLFQLSLDPQDPTRYQIDGVSEAMTAQPMSVAIRTSSGAADVVRRTLYRTRFGPVVDLGARNAALGWGQGTALAIRDINEDNHRIFRHFLRWAQAKSLDEFMQIHKREAAMPWVNTAAIGRGDGRVWYADIGAVPGVADDLRAACATPLSSVFAAMDPGLPLLDGTRSACQWQGAQDGRPGSMPVDRLPRLLREDYVANMNDSYWLTHPMQLLTGYASILGPEGGPLSMRGREGHRIAGEIAGAGDRSAQALAARVMHQTLEARSYAADQFKQPLLERACSPNVAPASADLRSACDVLRRWPNRADAKDRGVLLWDAFWARLQEIPAEEFFAQAFSTALPLQTPRGIRVEPMRVAQALIGAAADLRRKGWALDTPLGARRFARSGGTAIALFGGCDEVGYFTVACANDGDYTVNERSHGNSYLQVVYFDRKGVRAHTLLAHGERETAVVNGGGTAPVARYARKDWLRFPFSEEEIARDLRR